MNLKMLFGMTIAGLLSWAGIIWAIMFVWELSCTLGN